MKTAHMQPCTCPECYPKPEPIYGRDGKRVGSTAPYLSTGIAPPCWTNPAPHAAAAPTPAFQGVGTIKSGDFQPNYDGVDVMKTTGTITFHGPSGDITKEYNPLGFRQIGTKANGHTEDCCCEMCRHAPDKSALEQQVGGTHYKRFAIQPAEFIHKNKIGFLAGCAIKRLCRYSDKGGKEDLLKAIHEIEMLIEMEYPK